MNRQHANKESILIKFYRVVSAIIKRLLSVLKQIFSQPLL